MKPMYLRYLRLGSWSLALNSLRRMSEGITQALGHPTRRALYVVRGRRRRNMIQDQDCLSRHYFLRSK